MWSTVKSVSTGAAIAALFAEVMPVWDWCLVTPRSEKTSKLEFFAETLGLETRGLAGTHLLEIKARLPTEEPGVRWVTWVGQNFP